VANIFPFPKADAFMFECSTSNDLGESFIIFLRFKEEGFNSLRAQPWPPLSQELYRFKTQLGLLINRFRLDLNGSSTILNFLVLKTFPFKWYA
jgi:hypothetical protein